MIKIISCLDKNNLIGNSGKLPWSITEDMVFFKKTTINNIVIMGYNTFSSIGKPLYKRYNYVINNQCNINCIDSVYNNLYYSPNLLEAIKFSREQTNFQKINDIFIIGGAKIYKEALQKNLVDELILTKIDGEYTGDCFFPEIDSYWKVYNTIRLSKMCIVQFYKK